MRVTVAKFRDLVNRIRVITGAALVAYDTTESFFRSSSGVVVGVSLVDSQRVVLATNDNSGTMVAFTDTPPGIIARTARALIVR